MICAIASAILHASTPFSPGGLPQDRLGQAIPDNTIYLGEVVVTGRRRGDTGLDPEQELGPEDISAIGAWDVGEIVARLAETFSPEEAPMIIVNGRRLANPSDFLRFPPDALLRVEALPPEAAGLFGGEPGRRVVNIVMQPQFESRDSLLGTSFPTAGGTTGFRGDLRQSEIRDDSTLQFGVQGSRVTALWSDERPDTSFDHPGAPRTLVPYTQSVGASFLTSRPVGDWSANFGMTGTRQNMRSAERVRDGTVDQVDQSGQSLSLTGGMTGQVWDWKVRGSLNAQVVQSERGGPLSQSSDYRALAGDLGLDRRLFTLPAGPVRVSLISRHESARSDVSIEGARSQRSTLDHDVRALLNVPLFSAQQGATRSGQAMLTLGARARAEGAFEEADGGLSAALSWAPFRGFRLNAKWSSSTESPSPRQRLDPLVQGVPRILFDFQTGQAKEVVTFLGGNPDLRPESSTDATVGFAIGPVTSWRIAGGSALSRMELTDNITSLPSITPETEAAFPERFVRGADGTLSSVDLRPVNLRMSRLDTLVSTLNISIPVKDILGLTGSARLGVRHSFQLASFYVIRDGFGELDRLAGDGGGQPRHQLALTLDGRVGSWGFNGTLRRRGEFRIRRDGGRDGPDDLIVDPSMTVDLKLSYRLTRSVPRSNAGPARRSDTGLDLTIDNLLDSRVTARRGDGRMAPGYGRYDRDPIGRTIALNLTRRF